MVDKDPGQPPFSAIRALTNFFRRPIGNRLAVEKRIVPLVVSKLFNRPWNAFTVVELME